MHEHIARALYYFSVHLLYASIVGAAAWLLTTIRGASATTKYWMWVATALNFIMPIGAVIDKLWAPHLRWATPLGAIGGPIWNMTQGRTAVVLAGIWIAMASRNACPTIRIRFDRANRTSAKLSPHAPDFPVYIPIFPRPILLAVVSDRNTRVAIANQP